MGYQISHRHLSAGDERCDCRAKTDHDQRAGNEFDQTGDPEKRHEGRGCPVDAKRYCKYPRARHKK